MRGPQFCCRTYVGLSLMVLASTGVSASGPTSVVVSGRQLLVNGQPFLMKGVGYNPAPIGRYNPPAKDEDYFLSKYADLHTRDLAALRAMGANTVRLWGWDPNADHTDFLDKAWNMGNDSIYVIVSFWIDEWVIKRDELGDPGARSRVAGQFTSMIEKVKNHPAALMWCIGNELNSQWKYGVDPNFGVLDPNLFTLIDQLAEAAHNAESDSPNYHPVTTPLMDLDLMSTIGIYTPAVPHLDVWGATVYRGSSFGTLFTDYAALTTKPLVILEYGIDSYDSITCREDETTQADFAEGLWFEVQSNASQSDLNRVCIGSSIMAYSDEWWKGQDSPNCPPNCPGEICKDHDPCYHSICGTPRDADKFPDAFSNEEWYGIMRPVKASNPADPDIMQPKEAYCRLLKCWQSDRRTLSVGVINSSLGKVMPTCSEYGANTVVSLRAAPEPGGLFVAWWVGDANRIGDLNQGYWDANTSTTVMMDQARSATAWFHGLGVPFFTCGFLSCTSLGMTFGGLGLLAWFRRRS